MEYLLNAAQMKAADTNTISGIGIPSMVLMERAALAVSEEMEKSGMDLSRVLIVCGSGNNGGDGFALARLLNSRHEVTLAFVGKETSMTEETAAERRICENLGIKIREDFMEGSYTAIVDAMLGIGLSRPVEGRYAEVIRWINAQHAGVTAVDIPSGVSADDGKVPGAAVHADLTVTFAAKKIGQILYPGAAFCGKLICRDIGIVTDQAGSSVFICQRDDLSRLPARKAYSNKATYGKVLLIAGSEGMCGAALLAARAAYRSGCGMVRVLTPRSNRSVIQTALPEAIVSCYDPEAPAGKTWADVIDWADIVGIGPGLSTSESAYTLLDFTLDYTEKPMLIDADALNLLSLHPELMKKVRHGTILTPHIGEMSRLSRLKKEEITEALPAKAAAFASEHQVILVLKDARSVISDGERICINTSGNDGMAAAGSGDVLSGLICGLLAQGADAFDAASLGVYVHGLAGDAAAAGRGARGMMAGDLADAVGEVLKGETSYE